MTTFQASGAGQAIEDGFILASVLSQPSVTRATLPAALQVYDAVRRPFAQTVQERSRENGDISHLRRCGWEDVSAAQSAAGGFPREKLIRVGRNEVVVVLRVDKEKGTCTLQDKSSHTSKPIMFVW